MPEPSSPTAPSAAVPANPASGRRKHGAGSLLLKRLIASVLFGACVVGGVMIGVLGQPLIRPTKNGLVDVPFARIALPDPNAIATITALVGRANQSIAASIQVPVSKSVLDALVAAKRRGVRVMIALPSDAPGASEMLRSAGISVRNEIEVNQTWIAIDREILVLSPVPLSNSGATRVGAKIVILKGTPARTFDADLRTET